MYTGVPKGRMEFGPPLLQNIVLEPCSKSLKKLFQEGRSPNLREFGGCGPKYFSGLCP